MVSHRRPTRPGLNRGVRATVLSAAAATAAATLGAAPASAEPEDSHETAKATVDRLYEDAERATEQFNAARESLGRLRGRIDTAQDSAARTQEEINRLRASLGSMAGAQYRTGGIDPSVALLLSSDPGTFLDRAAALHRAGERGAVTLRKLRHAQRRIEQSRAEAAGALAAMERDRAAVARHKRTVEGKLARARQLLSALPAADRDELGRASRSGPHGGLSDVAASARGAAALMAARQALGRPYVWGANGPAGFDCSGLMQWAYARAGVGLPRTSQAQRYAGRMVPLSQARPGDLVAYRADASHIGMYAGGGQVIHAPYPGAPVRYDPVGMMPVSSVTRV
ncbi:NlpC/P60 family protein [Streptomyces sp. NPDC001822]|uniref:C40 family peptidase n=1 Tax=Streptomyces sp. NPDC001822 TaxID=3364614 RepID=UPI0036BE88F1